LKVQIFPDLRDMAAALRLRYASLPLPRRGTVDGITVGRNIIDFDGDNIAAPEPAVDRKIEQHQITDLLFHLELGPDSPDVFGPERRACAG
jgi:hypothetical protein